jgi:hypothetical protein
MNFDWYDAQLTGRCALRRKIANNTWLERRGDDTIAVRLHNTDVVTYHRDGRVQLFTGGWYTVTTKQRMNAYSPARVYSIKGRWHVREGSWDTGHDRPFADGITIHPDGTLSGYPAELDVAAQDRANAATRRRIKRFIDGITPDAIVNAFENSGGDCFMCRFGEGSCLADHVKDNYFHAHLALRAVKAKGYHNPDVIMSMIYGDAQQGRVDRTLTDSLRKLLVTNLIEGVATR